MQNDSALGEARAAFESGDLAGARALIEPVVASSPTASALHLIGLIECRSGKFDSGVDWLSRALAMDGDNPVYRVNLAMALIDGGRFREALTVADPAGSSPPELALWHMRAVAADGAQDWEASAQAWQTLSAAHPADWRVWNNAAHALSQLGRWPEAAGALRRAVDANPSELSLRRGLATALGRAGQHEESAAELGQWIEGSPDNIGARVMLARLLADLGRDLEASAQLDEAARRAGVVRFDGSREVLLALARQPGGSDLDVGVFRELALFLEATNRWDWLGTLFQAAEERGIDRHQFGYPAAAAALRDGKPEEARKLLLAGPPETNPIRWHWLMGRIADTLGDSDEAFAEAAAMNRSEADYEGWLARGRRHLESIRAFGEVVTPQWAATLRRLPLKERRTPAFLVGFPRSGTTLLDTFLMGHPGTQVLEEVPLSDAAQGVLGDPADLAARSEVQMTAARDAYFDELGQHVPHGFPGLVIEKFPLNMLSGPLLHGIFPDAPFIFAQRHPCDVVLSCFMQGFAMNDSTACFLDLDMAANYYDAAMILWMRSREALSLRVHTLVYEDLVTDPEATLRPLVAFLDLEWDAELLDHRKTAKARSAIGTASYNQVTEPLSRAASGRWKRYEKQLEPVLPILLPWAERLGYKD